MRRFLTLLACAFVMEHLAAQAPIKAVEYWFDTDHNTIQSIATNSATINLSNAMLNTASLSVGRHTVHLRMREDIPGNNGVRYSGVVSRPFQKLHSAPWQIVAVRYWMSGDPQPQDMQYKYFDTPQTTINYMSALDMCAFTFESYPHTGQLKVQLLDNHGQWSVVESRTVTITGPGVLVVEDITANSAAFCPGETYTFTANSFSGAGYATPTNFTWTIPQGNGWSAAPSTGASIAVIVGTAQGSISVISHNACDSSTSVSFAVALPDVPNISVSDVQPGEVCPNASNLTYAVTPDNTTWTYAWSGPAGWTFTGNAATMSASTGANPAAGNISITASNACGQAGNTVTIPVLITPAPAIAGSITGPDTLCEGSSATYQVAPISNATGYLWSDSGDTTTSASITAGATDFSITVQGVNACGIAGPTSQPFAVVVTPSPGTVSINGLGESCVGDDVSYVAEPLIPGAAYSWTWPSGFENMVQAGNSLTGTLGPDALSGDVLVNINTPACGLIMSTLEVAVSDVPDLQGNAIEGSAAVCEGSDGNYTLSAVAGAEQYVWTWPGGTISSVLPSTSLTFGAESGQVSVVAQNSCGLSVPATFAVEVDAPPQQPVIIGDTIVCNAGSTIFSVAEVQGESYTWSDGNTTLVGDSITVIGSGNWTVAATNGGACPSATALAQVIFEQVVAESITGDSVITEPGTYVYSVVPDLSGSVSYEWHIPFFAEGSSVGGTINLFVDTAGLDTLCVVALGTYCPNDTACMSVLIDSSVDAGEAGSPMNGWRIYPVPSRGIITVNLETSNLAAIDLIVENALGERVNTMQVQRTNTIWDLSLLANGTYFLRRTDRPTEVRKLLIQH